MGNKLFSSSTGTTEASEPPATRRRRDSDGYRQVDVFATFEHDADEDTNTLVYSSSENRPASAAATEVIRKSAKRCWQTVWRENWLFLIILGLIGAGVAMLVDYSTVKLLECMTS